MHRMQFSHVRTNWWKKDAASTLTDAMQDIDNLTTCGSGSQLCSASLYDAHGDGGGGFRSKLCAQQAHGDAQIEAMHMMVATVRGMQCWWFPTAAEVESQTGASPQRPPNQGCPSAPGKSSILFFSSILVILLLPFQDQTSAAICLFLLTRLKRERWACQVHFMSPTVLHTQDQLFSFVLKASGNKTNSHHCRTYVCHWYQIHVSSDWKIGSGDFQFCFLGIHSQKSKRLLENTDCHVYCTLAFTTLQTFQISAQIVIVFWHFTFDQSESTVIEWRHCSSQRIVFIWKLRQFHCHPAFCVAPFWWGLPRDSYNMSPNCIPLHDNALVWRKDRFIAMHCIASIDTEGSVVP